MFLPTAVSRRHQNSSSDIQCFSHAQSERQLATASCRGGHPGRRAFYQSHRHQIDHLFPDHFPDLEGSLLGRGEEGQGLRMAPTMMASGLLSVGEDWCKGRRSVTVW